MKTKQSSIVKPNHNNLQILCLCDNTDDITNKTLEVLNSSGVKICEGENRDHSYCLAELEFFTLFAG